MAYYSFFILPYDTANYFATAADNTIALLNISIDLATKYV